MGRVFSVQACLIPGMLLFACTHEAEPVAGGQAGAGRPTAAQKPPAKGFEVRLLESGAAPHRALRYRFGAQEKLSVEITLDSTSRTTLVHLSPPEVRFPTVKLRVGFLFEPVQVGGAARVSFSLDGSEVQAGADLPANVLDGLRADLAGLGGLAGFSVVDPRGLTREASAELPPGARPRLLKDQVEDLRQMLLQFAVPLPEEPVGPGARWEVRSELAWEWLHVGRDVFAFRGEQTSVYRLTALDGDRLQLEVELTRTFPAQEMMPSNEAGSPGRLEALQTQGTGRLGVDLRIPVPEASLSLATHKRTSAPFGPGMQARESTSDTTLKLTWRPQ